MRKNVLSNLLLIVLLVALANLTPSVAEATESGPLCDALIVRTDAELPVQIRASEPVDSVYLLDTSDRYNMFNQDGEFMDGLMVLRYGEAWWQPAVAQEGVEVIWGGDGHANEFSVVVPLGQEQAITLIGPDAPAPEDIAIWVYDENGFVSNQCNPVSTAWPADRVRVARWSWFRANALSEWQPAEFQPPTVGTRRAM